MLSDFVRELSQDIRTPITAAITSLYMVGQTPDQERQREKTEELKQHLFQLNDVLDQLQQMAVPDNTIELEFRFESLNRLVMELLHSYKARAVAKKVRLVLQLEENLPESLLDINAMDRTLRCLIDNAVRFTPERGTILVQPYKREKVMGLEISDNGIGIAGETLPYIFNRFYKAATSQQRGRSSAGLGLPMAKRIIDLHRGMIDVTSTVGIKTVVSIKLPLR